MKIAIIGGIGSGKSSVCSILSSLGEKVFDCDRIYREVMQDSEYKSELKKLFGDVFDEKGQIDNKKVSAIVLNDGEAVKKLNNLAHPYVLKKLQELSEGLDRFFVEVQVFEDSIFQDYFDKVWLVVSKRQSREKRVIARDNCNAERVAKIMAIQPDDNDRIKDSYTVIKNDGDLENLSIQVALNLNKLK